MTETSTMGCSNNDSAESVRALDVFCHCLPPDFCRAANQLLQRPMTMFQRAQQMPVMVDVESRLRMMDGFPGYCQVLSLASPTIESIATPDQAPKLARIANDALVEMSASYPDRFPGWIASLPMNAPEAACAEADRAVKRLGAVGIQVYTNVTGQALDHAATLAVVEHVASLGCPVWLHPVRPMTFADYAGEDVSKFDLWWALGWPHETSVAMGRLVFAGLFDRWPDVTVITHHCGGTIPMMSGRIEFGLRLLGTRNPPHLSDAVATNLVEPPISAFRRFHADTASFGSSAAIACAIDFFGIEQMLFATDSPFDPEQGPGYIRRTLRAIDDLELPEAHRTAILFGNAERLLFGKNQATDELHSKGHSDG
ncbi:MAG: amidohydrolase family protein [Planctomycetota bacterium]